MSNCKKCDKILVSPAMAERGICPECAANGSSASPCCVSFITDETPVWKILTTLNHRCVELARDKDRWEEAKRIARISSNVEEAITEYRRSSHNAGGMARELAAQDSESTTDLNG